MNVRTVQSNSVSGGVALIAGFARRRPSPNDPVPTEDLDRCVDGKRFDSPPIAGRGLGHEEGVVDGFLRSFHRGFEKRTDGSVRQVVVSVNATGG